MTDSIFPEDLKINDREPIIYKSLSSMTKDTGGKRETWRNVFNHPVYGSYFEIEHNRNNGIKIATKLTIKELKTLFVKYKKNVARKNSIEALLNSKTNKTTV